MRSPKVLELQSHESCRDPDLGDKFQGFQSPKRP